MGVCGHLVLLTLLLSGCGAAEYYVRPTEPTHSSCPVQPCLTLSQYANSSQHYFKSNAAFKFLPGIHHMDRPVIIRDVRNISLENFGDGNGKHPHLVAQFPCDTEVHDCIRVSRNKRDPYGKENNEVCCAAVGLHNANDVTVKGISLTVQTSNKAISGILFKNVSNITLQWTTTCSFLNYTSIGIAIFEATLAEVHSSNASNCTYGLLLYKTTSTHVIDTSTMHNERVGVALYLTTDTYLINTTAAQNGLYGMHLSIVNNTHIINAAATNNKYGMSLSGMNNTYITNATAVHNGWHGIWLSNMNSIYITNTTATHNLWCGISSSNMNYTHITATTASYNGWCGMSLSNMKNVHITSTTAAHNGWYRMPIFSTHVSIFSAAHLDGMYLFNVNDTHITNSMAAHNAGSGIDLSNVKNTHITDTTASNNYEDGIFLSYTNNTHITNCPAARNGVYGMSLFYMNNTHIANTTAVHNGLDGMNLSNMNNTQITNTTAVHNGWTGLHLSTMNNTHITNTSAAHNGQSGMFLSNMNNTRITETTAKHNIKDTQFYTEVGQIVLISSTYTLIYNTSFTNTYTLNTANPADIPSLPALIVLTASTVHFSECYFAGNKISATKARASNITLSGNVTFYNNTAFAGAAFILLQNSILHFGENGHINFINNHAINTGGVFHIANYYPIIDLAVPVHEMYACFLNTEGNRPQMQFTFVNNSAGKGGDILYGGCVAFGLDRQWNCLDSFKNMSNISQNGLSLISSDPSRICLCGDNGQPDCLIVADPKSHFVYPGQTIYISAVAVGQDFGTVSGSVYAQFLQGEDSRHVGSAQRVQGVTQHNCNHLSYTIFVHSEANETVLVLTAHDSHVSTIIERETDVHGDWTYTYGTSIVEPLININNPVYVKISLLPCPPGFMLTTDSPFKCDCDLLLKHINGFHCYIQEQTIGRSGLLWVGMIQDDNGTSGTVAASDYCSLDYCKEDYGSVTLSEPNSQCNYNHSGILCGGCQPGLSLALGSAQCLQCSNKYLALLIPLTLAGPVLVVFIKILDLTISQGTLNGLIFYANIVKANEYIFLPQGQTNPLTVFIAWLNLDLGMETCLCEDLTAYYKTWLQFVFPLYIWSIVGFIIILAKYSDRMAKVMGNNSVPVLATLILLSYTKLLRTIITALSYTLVYTSHGPKAVWTADGNVDYLGPKHAPLFATAVTLLLFLWLPYTLLLFLGKWLHKCNCQLINRTLMKVKPFLDAHYGPLKNKHHYWFGALLLVRAAILLISALVPANHSSVVILCISVFAVVLTHFGQMVYRNLIVSAFDTSFFMNLTILGVANSFSTKAKGDPTVAAYTLIGVVFVQFVGLVFFKVFSVFKHSEKVMKCLHKGQPFEDDWELYEEAVLLRGMESDSDEPDSECSGSIQSLPTY